MLTGSQGSGRGGHTATPCALLCMACGRLGDPAPSRPYRMDPASNAPPLCPHCGQPELADLASATTVLALTDTLEYERPMRRPRADQFVRRVAVVMLATVALGSFVLTLVMLATDTGKGWQGAAGLASLMLVLFGGPGGLLAARAIRREWRRTTPRRLPARWRLCLPRGDASGRAARAPVACEGAPLTAPISGRICVAFEVGLREDESAHGAPGTWPALVVIPRAALWLVAAVVATVFGCTSPPNALPAGPAPNLPAPANESFPATGGNDPTTSSPDVYAATVPDVLKPLTAEMVEQLKANDHSRPTCAADCADSDQPLARFGGLVAARRYDDAFEHFVDVLAAGARDDPRVQASFAGWLVLNAAPMEAARRLKQLAATSVATMEVQSYLGLLAGAQKRCAAALKHHVRAEQAQEPGTAIFIDFPRVIRRDARAIALYLQAITERRCKRGDLIATAERALTLDPSLAVAYTLIGEERHRKRDDAAAAAAYEKAIAADPEHAGAYIALGSMREDQCRFADALPLLDRGWQLNPWDDQAAYLLCHSYARANRRDDAIRACRSYVAHNRDADDADEIAVLVNLMLVAGDAIPDMIAGLDRDRCP